jgi:hypothetical protein
VTELAAACFVRWIGISPRKHLRWHARYVSAIGQTRPVIIEIKGLKA